MNKEALCAIIADLEAGCVPRLHVADFPCFSEDALKGKKYVHKDYLDSIATSLNKSDIPTFQRALRAVGEGELAWLGFKVIYDAGRAMMNVDNAVTKKYGNRGSADGDPLVFFCNDRKEIVASREPSDRDVFQMKDATRGPSMHSEQFEGVTWLSVPLFDNVSVWLVGASDVASEVALLACHVGFKVTVMDYDEAYLNPARFPTARRLLLAGQNFDELEHYHPSTKDYVCVLSRGHMFDPEGCIWATRHQVHYVGMMGCADKNDRVHELVVAQTGEEGWENVKRPIGLNFGAKTPAELAIAIVAELVDVRYRQRYSKEARMKHAEKLGR